MHAPTPLEAQPLDRDTAEGRAMALPISTGSTHLRAPLPHLGLGRYLVITEPDGQRIVSLDRPTMHIGRGISADITVDDTTVSRRHALIVHRGQRTIILDDRSLNGVFVNGRRITEAPLRDADVVTLGRVVLVYVDVY